jgi:hypothetical protein
VETSEVLELARMHWRGWVGLGSMRYSSQCRQVLLTGSPPDSIQPSHHVGPHRIDLGPSPAIDSIAQHSMSKTPCNNKHKQPLHPRRGPDGRWLTPPPNPEPPDNQGAESAHLVMIPNEMPVTAGGLVIREPSPHLSPLGPPVSPQVGVVTIRPVTNNGEQVTQQPPSLLVVAAIAQLSPKRLQDAQRQAQVTVETVTDSKVGLSWWAPMPIHHACACMERASPELEQWDSVLRNPIAWSMAQDAFQGKTQSHSVSSITLSVNKSRSSRNTQMIKQVMCEHAKRAKAHAQSAYEQNHTALDLISKSMDNIRNAFIKAKHTHN